MSAAGNATGNPYRYRVSSFEDYEKQRNFLRPYSAIQADETKFSNTTGDDVEGSSSSTDRLSEVQAMMAQASCFHNFRAASGVQLLKGTLERRFEKLGEVDAEDTSAVAEYGKLNGQIQELDTLLQTYPSVAKGVAKSVNVTARAAHAAYGRCCSRQKRKDE